MNETMDSDGLRLASHFARPPGFARVPGLVLTHGFPTGPRGGPSSASTYPELAERLARETGWAVLTFNFRGTGTSEGDFSLDGWLADLRHAVDALSERSDVGGVWLAGSSTGGSLAVMLAADDERVRGVATLAAPASFSEWAANPARLLADARALGIIRMPTSRPTRAPGAGASAKSHPWPRRPSSPPAHSCSSTATRTRSSPWPTPGPSTRPTTAPPNCG